MALLASPIFALMGKDKGWRQTVALGAALPVGLGLGLVWLSAGHTGGRFYYFFDDAYIHLGMAKNLLRHGVIGLNEAGGTNLASSPFYTFIAAGLLKVFGGSDQILWPLNMAVWVAMVLLMGQAFRHYGYGLRTFKVYLAAVALSLPPSIALLTGMEHLTHACLTGLLLIHWQGDADGRLKGMPGWGLALLAGMAETTRFETVMFTGLLVLADLYYRRFGRAAWLAAGTALPALGYLAWMHVHGASFIPNTIAIKAGLDMSSAGAFAKALISRTVSNLGTTDQFWLAGAGLPLLVLGGWEFAQGRSRALVPLLVAAGCLVASVLLTVQDGGKRYDLWLYGLVALGAALYADAFLRNGRPAMPAIRLAPLLVAAFGVVPYLPTVYYYYSLVLGLVLAYCLWMYRRAYTQADRMGALLLPAAAFITVGIVTRLVFMLPDAPRMGGNIYGQQVTFARFLQTYYPGQTAVLNDIGTTSFYTDCPIVDRAGLATTELVPYIRRYRKQYKDSYPYALVLDSLARRRGARLAVLYPDWLRRRPARWIEVATMTTVPVHNLLGDSVVAFYAFSPAEAVRLRGQLAAFAAQVPAQSRLRLTPTAR